jgi:hypothetical protein
MAQHSTVGVYSTLDEAVAAARSLKDGGFPLALLGGVEHGVAGNPVTGVLGWLFNLGMSGEEVRKYEEAIKAGKFLVIVHGTEDTVKKARDLLAGFRPAQLDLHALGTA